MAVKHRKLFPQSGTTNETIDCPNFCDPACPYNCYPYADYYLLPPPPPSPSQDHRLSPYVIVLVSVLASFFLVVSYYVIVAKSYPRWCGSRNNRHRQTEAGNVDDQDSVDENQVDHPIWFITTTGLQQSIINSITACKYKKGEGLIEGTECSVCLSEFQQDETVRLLPKCNHAFHISCVDTWLRSHTNCPLCRAHIVNEPINTPLISLREDTENVNTTSSTPMENPEIDDGELENTIQAGDETRGDEDDEDERTSKENVNSDTNGNFEIICESDNHHRDAENDVQPIRRSISTESLAAETMNLGLKITSSSIELENPEQSHTGLLSRQIGSSSISQHLHKSPVPMKRSFSCSGRFFSSRQNRNLNSILPL